MYSFYNSIYGTLFYFQGAEIFNPASLTTYFLISLAITLGLFALQGFGLYTMAKKRGLSKRYLAFIPFANFYYMGKLAGKCRFFGREMKGAHIYAMVAQIVTYVCCTLMIVAEIYLSQFEFSYDQTTGLLVPASLTGTALGVYNVYDVGGWFLSVVELISSILTFVLLIALYKTYNAKNHMILSFLYLFVPLSRFIVIPVLSKNTAVDYDEYMRQKREEYYRRQQQNTYHPYGQAPFGGGWQSPYGGAYPPPQNPDYAGGQPTADDPFGEFSNAGETQSSRDGGTQGEDEFFS